MDTKNHSFVIPAYGSSPYLEKCIESLMQQTKKSKILITTSTPSDFLKDIANNYQLELIINPTPSSIGNDWNFALGVTDTKYVTIAHQDDIYGPQYTERLLKKINAAKNKNVLIAFTGYWDLIDNQIRKNSLNAWIKKLLLTPFIISETITSKHLKKTILLFGNPICCPSVTFNKENISNFKFSTTYSCTLDWFAWYQLAKQTGSFLYINQQLVQHRIHRESETTNQITNGKRAIEEYLFFEQIWGKHIAGVLSRFYSKGYKNNDI
ncbi:glycosyltransferase family A protein [Pseudopedobacter beijingensis]|uniref:Glycosyltransferase family A protein n=1 Tax=Pseudopedobacter beijingensis TaxID=1207056 RepID=A0ABW4IF48_9SPHI